MGAHRTTHTLHERRIKLQIAKIFIDMMIWHDYSHLNISATQLFLLCVLPAKEPADAAKTHEFACKDSLYV
jgi:hypothetical protein